MRRSAVLLTVLLLLGAVPVLSTPAGASHEGVTGAGEATGLVTITPGVPLDGSCEEQTFTFSGVVLNGVFTDGTRHFAGSLTASNMNGASSGPECGTDGSGTIGTPQNPGTFQGSNATGAVTGTFYGTYARDMGARVTASVNVNLVLNGASYPGLNLVLDAAAFVPTFIDPQTGAVTGAAFAGEWRIG
jgi:hypothetical protein